MPLFSRPSFLGAFFICAIKSILQITETELGRVFWQGFSNQLQNDILTLLRAGEPLSRIEAHVRKIVDTEKPELPEWKRKEIAGRYFMAAKYAKTSHLHLPPKL